MIFYETQPPDVNCTCLLNEIVSDEIFSRVSQNAIININEDSNAMEILLSKEENELHEEEKINQKIIKKQGEEFNKSNEVACNVLSQEIALIKKEELSIETTTNDLQSVSTPKSAEEIIPNL